MDMGTGRCAEAVPRVSIARTASGLSARAAQQQSSSLVALTRRGIQVVTASGLAGDVWKTPG